MTFEAVLRAPLRSAAFRFAVLLALIFAIGAGALLFTVRSQIGHYAAEATSGRLKAEVAILGGEYAQLGQSGLTDAIARHQSVGDDAQFHYLLVDAQRRRRDHQGAQGGWWRGAVDTKLRSRDGSALGAIRRVGRHPVEVRCSGT